MTDKKIERINSSDVEKRSSVMPVATTQTLKLFGGLFSIFG